MTLPVEELCKRFLATNDASPTYTNYAVGEMKDGSVLYLSACAGHKTMLDAICCHDKLLPVVKQLEKKHLGKYSEMMTVRFVIAKETVGLEFLEAEGS